MSIHYGFDGNGAFIVVDTTAKTSSYSYPTSSNERSARKDPERAARTIARTFKALPIVPYDRYLAEARSIGVEG